MTPEQWQQIEELLHAVLVRQPEERAEFLAEAGAGSEAVRQEVESLVAAHEQAQHFIESPALEVAAKAMAADYLTPPVGREINHFKLLSLLGAGGMGTVYLAEDAKLGRSSCCPASSLKTASGWRASNWRRGPPRHLIIQTSSPFMRSEKLTGCTTSPPNTLMDQLCGNEQRAGP